MSRNKGFTLIEVLISLLILVIGIMAVVTMLLSSLKMTQESQEATEATFFVASLSSILDASDPDNLSAEKFAGLTFNNKPVIITFSKSTLIDQKLVRVDIALEMKSGLKRTFVMYITSK